MKPIHTALLTLPFLVASIAPAAAAQAPGTPTPPENRPWNLFDRVEVIVNEKIVTVSEFNRDFYEFARSVGGTPTIESEIQQMSQLVAQRKVDSLLSEQGGHDLGFDEAQVRRMVSNWEDSLIEEAGGVGQRSEALLADGSTAHMERAQLTGDIYRVSWERAVTGRDAGPLGRPMHDRYVRPGQLSQLYKQAKPVPGGLEQLGVVIGDYRLQLLILGVDKYDDFDAAMAQAEEIQHRLAEGESFDDLVEEFSAAKGQDSIMRPLGFRELAQLARQQDVWAELARWALEAKAGEHSDSIHHAERGRESIQISRLLERPTALAFESAAAQASLRKHTQGVRDDYLRGRALDELRRSAYIWTPEYAPEPEDPLIGPPAPTNR